MCKINVKTIIKSSLADDDKKGDLLFCEIKAKEPEGGTEENLSRTHIKIVNMENSMLELLKESVRTARLMYG